MKWGQKLCPNLLIKKKRIPGQLTENRAKTVTTKTQKNNTNNKQPPS
jgi:hypothetical protein